MNDHPLFRSPSGACDNCHVRPATSWWTGESSSLDVARGFGVRLPWCEVCCLDAQIGHCRKMAARIPVLETQRDAELAKCGGRG